MLPVSRFARTLSAMASALTIGGYVMAAPGLPPIVGPDWEEGFGGLGDAGSTPGSSQTPQGSPLTPLTKITGSLDGIPSIGSDYEDFQDMYCIFISGPTVLSVSADPNDGGSAKFNAQLWLFDSSGLGLLGTANSSYGNQSNDDSGILINQTGIYYICITGLGSVPFSQSEYPLFDFGFDGEVSGPDGAGGGDPIAFWSPTDHHGKYEIVLEGIAFAPAPGSALLLVAAGFAGGRRRRS